MEDPEFLSCPENVTGSTPSGTMFAAPWIPPVATDNSGNVSVMSTMYAVGSDFPEGLYEITYSATDGAGRMAMCSYFLNVLGE